MICRIQEFTKRDAYQAKEFRRGDERSFEIQAVQAERKMKQKRSTKKR